MTPTGVPHITVEPRKVKLKTTGDASVEGQVVVGNTGTGPLNVTVTGPKHNPPFSIDSGGAFTVQPSAESTVIVTFAPSKKGTTDDKLNFKSNDTKHPKIRVNLIGISK